MSKVIRVTNPRTGKVDFEFPATEPAELRDTCSRLREANPGWAAGGVAARLDVLREFAKAIEAHQAELLQALIDDTGRYAIAAVEASFLTRKIESLASTAPALLEAPAARPTHMPAISGQPQYVPYELMGNITPWNFPFLLSMIDTLSALVAGCCVVVKPSEVASRFVAPVQKALAEVPEMNAVCAFVRGGGEVGAALISQVDVVSFTGSVRTGRKVAEAAAKAFIPAYLELGGKDPLIVTACADLDMATEVALRASVAATGQACQSIERVYVDASVHDAFVERLVEKARKVEINFPDIHQGHVGPFIFPDQADVVRRQVDDAVAKGAQVLCGGEIIDHGGKWCLPTVLTQVTHQMDVMTHETFGPVIPVMAYQSVEQAIEFANDSRYGLSANVVAGDLELGEAIARQLRAGAVSVNEGSITSMVHEFEHESFNESGMGRSRMGDDAIMRYLRKKAVFVNRGQPVPVAAFQELPAAGS